MNTDRSRSEFLQQRNAMRQIAWDLAEVVRRIDPVACGIRQDVWLRATSALKQIDLGRGIGGYQFPISERTP
jgi:hypothetical protein